MKEPEVKDYSLFTQEQIDELLQKEHLQKIKVETKNIDDKEVTEQINDTENKTDIEKISEDTETKNK